MCKCSCLENDEGVPIDLTCSTGIGPEVFAYIGSDGGSNTDGPGPSASDLAFYNQHGFYIYDGYVEPYHSAIVH